MFTKLQNIFSIPELKSRILFTAGILAVYRLGGHIPAPGVDGSALKSYFAGQQGTLFGLYDMFVGGAFERATVFALGIMPYISASIIIQLFGAVIPYFEKLQKEGEEGRKKITQLTRYGTVGLAAVQAFGIGIFLQNLNSAQGMSAAVVPNPGPAFLSLIILTLTAGTIFIMWLGEQITERGIGNGISLIITMGIVAQYPNDILATLRAFGDNQFNIIELILLAGTMLAVTVMVVLMTLAVRKIPVQYAKRVVGRKMYGGQSTHIPLRVNTAGVMPIIFAQSIIAFPGTLAALFPGSDLMASIQYLFSPGAPIYVAIYGLMIVFFTYFYTAIVLNPVDLADNMRKYGGFIPGIRPGKKTAEYIDRVLTRITLPGAIFLAFIAILPDIMIAQFNVPFYFGGTGLLIVVGVMLDTMSQIESHLHMRHYEGLMKHGKLKSQGRVSMILVFLGPPGVGKGTQASLFCEDLGYRHVSTGELLREAVVAETPLGLAAKATMEQGNLVPDDVILGLIEEVLEQSDRGVVLDGFPRTLVQAAGLEALLAHRDRDVDGVVLLTVEEDELLRRMLARGRTDDTPETVRHRQTVYRENTKPLIEFYRERGQLRTVDGMGSIPEIQKRIRRAVEAA